MTLNDPQRRAVEHEGPPLIVLAGPGTGKTRVITQRVAHLIERGADPETVVALTFTNKAAGELRERLAALVGLGVAERIQASTFHALGLRLLQRFGDRAGLGSPVRVMDSAQQRRMLRELALERGVYGRVPRGVEGEIDRARRVIAQLRHAAVGPGRARAFAAERLSAEQDDAVRAELGVFARDAELYALFDAAARERGWVTFDDVLTRPVELIESDALAATLIRSGIRHVVVDEFQDVNTAQIDLLRALAPPASGPDLVVVGDDDQSIYAFRGADDRAFERFTRTWEGAETIALTETYRSPAEIVNLAERVIARAGVRFAPDKTLEVAPGREGPAGLVEVVELGSYDEAGEVIGAEIAHDAAEYERAYPGGDGEGGGVWSRYAVIARNRKELERVRQGLELRGIPVESVDEAGALEDEGVRDLLGWVELILDPEAAWAAQRALVRAPISADPAVVLEWMRAYRAAKSRGEPGAFAPWVAEHAKGGAGEAEAARFAELAGELAGIAARARADEAMGEIVRKTGLVHADLVSGRGRAERVRAVVGVLRFVRERADRLDEPGDLAAWVRYYEDLDERDKGFATPVGARAMGEADAGEERVRPNAVSLLTAHAAKGLEFDTVFVSGVSPKPVTAFPNTRTGDDPVPEGVIDRVGDGRSAKERAIDEERRLFYVACTRAQRRVVLLGEVPKKTSSTHFLVELRGAEGVSWRRSGEVLAGLAGEGAPRDEAERVIDELARAKRARSALEEARRAARLDAAAALARADAADGDPGEAIEALAEAARRMAAAGGVERSGRAPGWAEGAGVGVFARTLAAAVGAEEVIDAAAGASGLEPLSSPLRLSFTGIAAYERCPRCFYVEHALRLPRAPAEAQRFGRGVHQGLCAFYQRWGEADSAGEALPGEAELVAMVRSAVERAYPARDTIGAGVLDRAEAQARVVWEHLHDPSANIVELEKFVKFPFEVDGCAHTLEAAIDRVDEVGGAHRIVDYKTGRASRKLTEAKPLRADLQMGIYTMAVRHLFESEELEGVCEYWFVGEGVRGSVGFDEIDMDAVRGRVEAAVRGMLAGAFERSAACLRDGADAACSILDRV